MFQLDETDMKILDKVYSHSFFYNPRDTNRYVNLLLSGKQVDERKKLEIIKAYELGHDKNKYLAYKAYGKEIKIITKIENFRLEKGVLKATLANGEVVRLSQYKIAEDPESFLNAIRGLMVMVLEDGEVIDAKAVEPANNYQIAKELLEKAEAQHITWLVLLKMFGYKASETLIQYAPYYLLRLFPLFRSPYSGRYINEIEISNRGTGKTTTYLLLKEVFNFKYYTEMPSVTNLIYDARTGTYGAVYTHQGVILDEIQNYKDSPKMLQNLQINSALSTGLENCTWTRGMGAEDRSIDIQKCIPIVYSGNPLNYQLYADVEAYLDSYKIFTPAILDRIHIINIMIKPTFDKVVDGYVAYPSVLRAFVQLLHEKLTKVSMNDITICDNFTSRRAEEAVDIQLVLKALDLDIAPTDISDKDKCNVLTDLMRMIDLGGKP